MLRGLVRCTLLVCLTPKSVEGISVRGAAATKPQRGDGLRRYVLLGPEDSGTNLLEEFIEVNWPQTFMSSQGPDDYYLWKHSNSGAADIYKVLSQSGFGNISALPAVAMVRSPISLVASWMREPYDMSPCVERPVVEFDEPCLADLEARKAGIRSRAGDTSTPQLVKFSSTMDVYNRYLQQYHDIGAEGKFASFLLVNYEDLVYSPEVMAKLLGDTLGVEPPLNAVTVEDPAKEHGDAASRAASLAKLQERSYLSSIGADGLQSLCPHLNVTLVSNLKEGTYLDDEALSYPYTWDCREYLQPLNR